MTNMTTSIRTDMITSKLLDIVNTDDSLCDSIEVRNAIEYIKDANPLTQTHLKSITSGIVQQIKDPYFLVKLKYIFNLNNIDIPGIDSAISTSILYHAKGTSFNETRSFITGRMIDNHRLMVNKLSISKRENIPECLESGLNDILGDDYADILDNDPMVFRVDSYEHIYSTLIEDNSLYIENIIPRFHSSFILHNFLENVTNNDSSYESEEEKIISKLRTVKLSSQIESNINNIIYQSIRIFINYYYIEARDKCKETGCTDISFDINSGIITEEDIPSKRVMYDELEREASGTFNMIESIKFFLISDLTDKKIIDLLVEKNSIKNIGDTVMPITDISGNIMYVETVNMDNISINFRYSIIHIIAHLMYTIIIEAGIKAYSDEMITNLFINETLTEQLNSNINKPEYVSKIIKHIELTAFWTKILKI